MMDAVMCTSPLHTHTVSVIMVNWLAHFVAHCEDTKNVRHKLHVLRNGRMKCNKTYPSQL